MSSILKALEKVEESQGASRTGKAAGFKKTRERRRPWLLPISVFCGAVVAALATFAAMGGFSHTAAPVQEAAVAQPAPVAAAPATPVTEASTPQPSQRVQADQPVQPVPAEPARQVDVPTPTASPAPSATASAKPKAAATVSPKPAARAAATVSAKPTATTAAVAKPAAKAAAKPAAKVAAKPAAKPAAVAAVKPVVRPVAKAAAHKQRASTGAVATLRPASARSVPVRAASAPVKPAPLQAASFIEPAAPVAHEKGRPEIRVTGIAWQNESASSAAIVNGRSVQQGGTVEGYKVEKILEDKVVFSGSNGRLEVHLGAGEQ